MRIFTTFPEAFNELRRELAEMGLEVRTQTVQDKDITDNPDYWTKELQNYCYTVTKPTFRDLNPVQPWANAEWEERKRGIEGEFLNPGESWRLRTERDGDVIEWAEMLEINGEPFRKHDGKSNHEVVDEALDAGKSVKFSYAYPERLATMLQVNQVIDRLRQDPMSRQMWVSIWNPNVDPMRFGKRRVPCSLGYHFMFRGDKLNITYVMRSCELGTHFVNDVWMAMKLLEYVSAQTGLPMGTFTHMMFSFHCYNRNLKGVY